MQFSIAPLPLLLTGLLFVGIPSLTGQEPKPPSFPPPVTPLDQATEAKLAKDLNWQAILKAAMSLRITSRVSFSRSMAEHALPGVMAPLLGSEGYATTEPLWNIALKNTFIIQGQVLSSSPAIAFYNPFLDVLVLTEWDRSEDPKIRKIAFLTGSLYVGRDPARPLWSQYGQGWVTTRFIRAYQDVSLEFWKQHPEFGASASPLPPGNLDQTLRSLAQSASLMVEAAVKAQEVFPDLEENLNTFCRAMASPESEAIDALLDSGSPTKGAEVQRAIPLNRRKNLRMVCTMWSEERQQFACTLQDEAETGILYSLQVAPGGKFQLIGAYSIRQNFN